MKRTSVITAILGIVIGVLLVITIQTIQGNQRKLRTQYKDWRKLNLILQTVSDNYVDSIEIDKVTDATISSVLASLDPHSIYLEPRYLEESESELADNFDGIGIQFNVPNDTAVVIEVINGGPSEKVGLKPGDRILRVDTTTIAGVKFPQDSMVRRMKGPAGTKVHLKVLREGTEIPFEITRGKIPVHCVDACYMVNDTTGYIRLGKFSRSTYKEVAQAALELKEEGMKKLIFDIRENSGGYFDQALLLCNLFLDKGRPIVYMEGKHRKREDYYADGKGFLTDVPLFVLINENTASSSEIFSGAMQDNGRGIIIGRRSFGKGLVQEPTYFTDGSAIRLTVARFYTPSGRCIQKEYGDAYQYEIYERYRGGEMINADSMKVEKGGIVPDIFVPVDTTKVDGFYSNCVRKATTMRFASSYLDSHRNEIENIDNFESLVRYLDSSSLENKFLNFAKNKDGLEPTDEEWKTDKPYMMTQVRALVGRSSKLGENAYYQLYQPIDEMMKVAIAQ